MRPAAFWSIVLKQQANPPMHLIPSLPYLFIHIPYFPLPSQFPYYHDIRPLQRDKAEPHSLIAYALCQ